MTDEERQARADRDRVGDRGNRPMAHADQLAEARRVLKLVEWGDGGSCLVCFGFTPPAMPCPPGVVNDISDDEIGHRPDCALAKVLAD